MRLFGTAKFAQNVTIRWIPVVNSDMIVIAFLMGFHLENFENLDDFEIASKLEIFAQLNKILVSKIIKRFLDTN